MDNKGNFAIKEKAIFVKPHVPLRTKTDNIHFKVGTKGHSHSYEFDFISSQRFFLIDEDVIIYVRFKGMKTKHSL